MKRFVFLMVLSSLILQTTACGTLLYPERKNQGQGKLDIGVVALNGIGLLFFLIPGVIAYAVDFNNDTIYLPKSYHSEIDGNLRVSEMSAIHVDDLSDENIRKIVYEKTGKDIGNTKAQVYKINANGEKAQFTGI
jgi:hypothetical protein